MLRKSPIWQKLRWWHGVLFYLAMNAISGGWLATRSYLDAVGRPPYMPPDWAFAPIWILLQALMILAGFHLLQRMQDSERQGRLFWLYVALWSFFSMFSWAYFGLHSPILGFLTTFGMFLANAANLWLGYQERDKRYAMLLTPLMIWLMLAMAVSGWQLLYTPDEFFGASPPLKPER
ncbi:MAG: tryptophan-rich sensory protein [Chloroherpetonaceae bacterium]|nr:tryptophan-rich sensory protein [Chloroherpetonaceae bacterium]MDW8436988.1 TspO/MBR family protein [Chloroherpetonaceae bacterium]